MNPIHLEQPRKEKYLKNFEQDGYLVVQDFLNPMWADKLYRSLDQKVPDWWYKATNGQNGKNYTRQYNTNDVDSTIQNFRDKSMETFTKKQFSYTFSRSLGNHVKGCICDECAFKHQVIESQELISWLGEITGIGLTGPGETFSSSYTSGDYLSIHTDGPNGKVAFVLNMTKDWSPTFGGNLHVLDQNCFDVEKVLVPRYNCLVLFNITNGGKPHFVSHVVDEVKQKRLSYTGWYK